MHTNLDSWMRQREISNNELAERMNVSPSLVSLFANGKRQITDGFKWRFAECFGYEQARTVFGAEPVIQDAG